MSATPSDPVPAPSGSTPQLYKLFNSSTDSRIAHLNRVLSTASGIDSTLCFVGYGLVFVSSQLQKLATLPVKPITEKLANDASESLGYEALYSAKLTELAGSTKVLGGLCSDVRTFMRLWGLLKIWAGAKATYFNPPKDSVLKTLAWGQLSAMGGYLYLENGLYLAGKGVLKGWSPEVTGKRFRAAIWIFFGYLIMDYARLWRVSQLREQKALSMGDEKEAKIKLDDEDRAWWRSLQVALSYSPLCFHWGLENGLVSDTWVGLLGASAGFAGFKEALRVTA